MSAVWAGVNNVGTGSGGYRIRIHSRDGLITALRAQDAEGDPVQVRGFGYDDPRRLVEVINGSGQPLRLSYDREGRLTGWTDRNGPNGATWRRTYSPHGELLTATDPAGATTRFGYDDQHRPATITDAAGAITRNDRDTWGRISAIPRRAPRSPRLA